MSQVVHRDRPNVVLYDGPDPDGFINQNEPLPHAVDGELMPQLVVKESAKEEEE
jgi:hypothetical protein